VRGGGARVAAAAALLCACTHEPERASGHIVVRDAQGGITRELRATDYGFWVKPSGPRIRTAAGTVDAGEVRMEGDRLMVKGALRATVERAQGRVSVIDAIRAPLGALVDREGGTWAYDPGGTPVGSARADGDRVVLTDRDGNARGYVSGLPARAAAALLLGGGLSAIERDTIAIALR